MANPVVVRKINPDELDQLLELYTYFPSNVEPLPSPEIIQVTWNSIMANPHLHYFVVEYENKLVSTCNLAIIPNLTHGVRPLGLIENVVTAKAYENRGFGQKVLQYAKKWAKKNLCHKVVLLTGSKQPRTLKFYEKAGFKQGMKTGFVSILDDIV
ncbi:GNAT family N-acetyltransferase [Candidatus Lokiarchaeum ossiferum]|uniref:GNAT family N-acetyltransferase n=1 Tax=Candidatus Lokiarchaeum ossiferum TaxID=2951803 RepID=UPI00352F1328